MKKILIILIMLAMTLFAQGQRIIKIADIEEGDYTTSIVKVCDRDGDIVTLDFNDLPSGVNLFNTIQITDRPDVNECSGAESCLECFEAQHTSWFSRTFEWTPNYLQSGQYEIKINAVDHRGKTDEAIYIINVSDKNRSPSL